jgi:hypothetical protein
MSSGFVENWKHVVATAGIVTTNGGVTCDTVSLKNVHEAYIELVFLQAATHATVINPVTGTGVASCATAITFAAPWWKNADISATDTLVAQTAATTASCTLGVANQHIIIKIDPQAISAQLATYTALGCVITTSGEATNFVSVVYHLLERYPQATPPAAITD